MGWFPRKVLSLVLKLLKSPLVKLLCDHLIYCRSPGLDVRFENSRRRYYKLPVCIPILLLACLPICPPAFVYLSFCLHAWTAGLIPISRSASEGRCVLSEGRGELTGLTAGLHGYGWGRRQEPKAGPELHSNQCIKGVTDRSRG